MEHSKHLLIALLVTLAVAAGGGIALSSLVPESFEWRDGWHYRADSLAEEKEIDFEYAADGSCLRPECHGEKAGRGELAIVLKEGHEALSCQTCHGPAEKHVRSEGKEPGPKAPTDLKSCMLCHLALAGRPARIEQISSFEAHRMDMRGPDFENCLQCHGAHACAPVKLEKNHKGLASCHACHRPDGVPLDARGRISEADRSKEVPVCMACHGKAEPGEVKSKKLIEDFKKHRDDNGGKEGDTCSECHDPHAGETL